MELASVSRSVIDNLANRATGNPHYTGRECRLIRRMLSQGATNETIAQALRDGGRPTTTDKGIMQWRHRNVRRITRVGPPPAAKAQRSAPGETGAAVTIKVAGQETTFNTSKETVRAVVELLVGV